MSLSHFEKYLQTTSQMEIPEQWKNLYFVDIFSNELRGVAIRRINVRCSMSANSLCFCGSGKKHKKCHPTINENSVVANLLRVFHQIDEECSNIDYSVCGKGCSDCCSDYFQISIVEFFTILHHIGINTNLILTAFEEKAIASLNGVNLPQSDYYNIPSFAPCIFLDDTTNECKIYEVRPIICRTYGSYTELTKCERVLTDANAVKSMLSIKGKTEYSNNIDYFTLNGSRAKVKANSIVYWFSKLGDDKTQKFQDLQTFAVNRPANEFIKILFM